MISTSLGKRLAFVSFLTLLLISGNVLAERQPLMNKALANLERAEKNLSNATHDKGGHRVEALKLVRQAIAEVRKGMRYDNRN